MAKLSLIVFTTFFFFPQCADAAENAEVWAGSFESVVSLLEQSPRLWTVLLGVGVAIGAVRLGGASHWGPEDAERFENWLRKQKSPSAVTDTQGIVLATERQLGAMIPGCDQPFDSGISLVQLLQVGKTGPDCAADLAVIQRALEHGDLAEPQSYVVRYQKSVSLQVSLSPQLGRDGNVAFWLWVLNDNSKHHRLQQHNEHSEKMQAISRLAGGMAHEFNNLLTAILGNLELLRTDLDRPVGDVVSNVEAAETASLRASQLIHELRRFASRDVPAQVPQSVVPTVKKVRRILSAIVGDSVSVSHSFDNELELRAEINQERLEEALLKLGLNAIDAIGTRGGAIHFRVGTTVANAEQPGLTIAIEDTGEGMSRATADKAFEPFFTTRDHEASGLGMAIAYGLIEEMGGTITIEKSSAAGSIIVVRLPLAIADSDDHGSGGDSSVITPPRRLEVAVVDSEPGIRKVAMGMLKLLGHAASTFDSGDSFLSALEAGKRHDLVLMDNAMPGMTGRSTYAQLRTIDSDVPVVICSGRSVSLPQFCPDVQRQPDAFLPKPFSIADLSATLAPHI